MISSSSSANTDEDRAKATAKLVLDGSVRHAAKLMRGLDDQDPSALEVLSKLHSHTGRAWAIGITGPPGVGKSTLIDAMVELFRRKGRTVGVVAVDPTSPFSGGAIMGDRIRMQRHATDPGVFIRSLATRGHLGGLTASAGAVIKVLDAMGFEVILIETVGVGQVELEVAGLADTTMVVSAPGLGDGIQALKAGILEVGDVLVVNKSDLPGAEQAAAALNAMLEINDGAMQRQAWATPVVSVSAGNKAGLGDLLDKLQKHWEHLNAEDGKRLKRKRSHRVRQEMMDIIKSKVVREIFGDRAMQAMIDSLVDDIVSGKCDAHTVCERLLRERGRIDQGGA